MMNTPYRLSVKWIDQNLMHTQNRPRIFMVDIDMHVMDVMEMLWIIMWYENRLPIDPQNFA